VKIVTRKLVKLSSQELVDCVELNHGCKGGFVAVAFYYISNYGISLAKDYPWKGFQMPCNIKKGNQKIFIAGFESIISENDSGAEIVKN
jgi:hypothetical protein